MSSRHHVRILVGQGSKFVTRRGFTTSLRRRAGAEAGDLQAKVAGGASSAGSGWSTRAVWAVAAGAGLVGCGVSSMMLLRNDSSKLVATSVAVRNEPENRYATMPEMEQAIQEIIDEIGDEDLISTDPEDLHRHGYSSWSSVNPDNLPVAVAYPRNTEQVAAIARICYKYRVPIIPYSGGSSLEGNFSAPYGGVSIDFAYMDQIIQFNKEDMDIVVQPSIGWQDLNETLAKMGSGLFFPIDPGPSAKIGGMIGTNCSGTNAVKYGTMKDWIINLTVVLADGRVIKTRRRPRKSSAGYNLNSLFVGSEGTLGIVTEATLKLAVVPEEFSVAVVPFPSIRDAASVAAGVMQAGIPVASMEIMDEVQMRVVNLGGATAPRVWEERPTLFFKFAGSKASVQDNIDRVQEIAKANKGGKFEFAKDAQEQKLLWSARKESLWSMLALRKGDEDVWSTDVAVPFSRLADLIEISKKEMDDLGLFASILGHIGDGNFHESIMYDRSNKEEREKVERCVKNMVRRALDMGGTCTGEHGIGWGKKESLVWEVGPETIGVMQTIKSSLDPLWIMNPGKIIDVPWMEGHELKREDVVAPVRAPSTNFQQAKEWSIDLQGTAMPANKMVRVEGWESWDEVEVKVHGLPKDIELAQLWDIFSRHGEITRIDVFSRSPTDTTMSAKLCFEPPPSYAFWEAEPYIVMHPDKVRELRLDVVPVVEASDKWILSKISSRKGPSRKYARTMKLQLREIKFGCRTGEQTMAVKRTFSSTQKQRDLKMEVNSQREQLTIYLPMRPTPENGLRVSAGYKLEIDIPSLKQVFETAASDGHRALTFSVPYPPRYFRRVENLRSSIQEDERIWRERDGWNRVTEFVKDHIEPLRHPVALHTDIRDPEYMEIGKWLTFSLLVDVQNDKARQSFDNITAFLKDLNVSLEPNEKFEFRSDMKQTVWDFLRHDPGINNSAALAQLEENVPALPFAVRYQLEVCLSKGILDEHNVTAEFLLKLAELGPEKARHHLEWLADQEKPEYNPMSLFENPDAEFYYPNTNLPHYCTLVRKVNITPTRICFSTPTLEKSNRVTRKYNLDQDRFLRVQFVNETENDRIKASKFRDADDDMWRKLLRVLFQGIQIGDRNYEFLAFGSSQLRQAGAYFFCPTDHLSCDQVRSWMGNFDHIKIIAKYAARLGQCFSTTREIRRVGKPEIRRIPDIERNGYCFTDGVGMISEFLSRIVIEEMELDVFDEPSTFQFRMGGHKGVLVNWPQAKGMEVLVRASQEKFEAEYNGLEVIKCAKYATATLNRQTIVILECLGVPIKAFMGLLEIQLGQYKKSEEDDQVAIELLTKFVDENHTTLAIADLIKAGFKDIHEPFVLNVLTLWRAWSMKLLKEKARILVDKSAFVLGCVDETGTLKGHSVETEGSKVKDISQLPEIFLQISDPKLNHQKRIITGVCIVGRNPSLHPGDIRVVHAVDNPELHHLKDVVVFPSTGDRPIPNMLSGGDLDGDDFFIIWEPSLIPDEWNFPPMNYSGPKPEERTEDVSVEDLCNFFVQYLQKDVLGLIATNHLAFADEMGPKSDICLRLAELHSDAVDFPKTGKPADYSHKKLRAKIWPHFMDKKGNSRRSCKALGVIYDKLDRETFQFKPNWEDAFDQRILKRYQLDHDILKAARTIKTQYDMSTRRLLAQQNLATEFELWTGFAMSKAPGETEYKRQETLGHEFDALKQRFRELCYEKAGGRSPDKIDPFVAAMYKVTEEEVKIALFERERGPINDAGRIIQPPAYEARSMPLITFPWIFYECMIRIAGRSIETCN
ncbi:RNA dependent RNA polymerase-domain-containing protein [Stachybotrys elegans]|uniref:RNA dependent RNA polymerase-domain-containing protein n=1 Tax=Stachybotrys elegans TaxID=80388 RepID=A0A8K0WK50_9HYPO|nr:RNA dependent RNA polymerase-domain-containing protein [Stachybotrys elegans]